MQGSLSLKPAVPRGRPRKPDPFLRFLCCPRENSSAIFLMESLNAASRSYLGILRMPRWEWLPSPGGYLHKNGSGSTCVRFPDTVSRSICSIHSSYGLRSIKEKEKKPTGRSRTYLRGFFLLALRHPSAIVLKQRGTDGDYFDNRGYLRSATTCPTVPPGEALLDVILILSVEGQPVAMTTMT